MKKKSNAAQAKANRVLRSRAMEASAESAIRAPAPDTWAARMPAYTYTQACPDPGMREPPQRKDKIMETTKLIGVHKICLRCRKRYPLKESKCICGGWLYVTGVYRSKMRIGGGVGGETGTGGTLRKGSSKST